jgi:hypothetical protein
MNPRQSPYSSNGPRGGSARKAAAARTRPGRPSPGSWPRRPWRSPSPVAPPSISPRTSSPDSLPCSQVPSGSTQHPSVASQPPSLIHPWSWLRLGRSAIPITSLWLPGPGATATGSRSRCRPHLGFARRAPSTRPSPSRSSRARPSRTPKAAAAPRLAAHRSAPNSQFPRRRPSSLPVRMPSVAASTTCPSSAARLHRVGAHSDHSIGSSSGPTSQNSSSSRRSVASSVHSHGACPHPGQRQRPQPFDVLGDLLGGRRLGPRCSSPPPATSSKRPPANAEAGPLPLRVTAEAHCGRARVRGRPMVGGEGHEDDLLAHHAFGVRRDRQGAFRGRPGDARSTGSRSGYPAAASEVTPSGVRGRPAPPGAAPTFMHRSWSDHVAFVQRAKHSSRPASASSTVAANP